MFFSDKKVRKRKKGEQASPKKEQAGWQVGCVCAGVTRGSLLFFWYILQYINTRTHTYTHVHIAHGGGHSVYVLVLPIMFKN